MKADEEYGYFRLNLKTYMRERGISKYFLESSADLQYTQMNRYYNNEIQRIDMAVLARICYALGCEIGEILEYIPPEK